MSLPIDEAKTQRTKVLQTGFVVGRSYRGSTSVRACAKVPGAAVYASSASRLREAEWENASARCECATQDATRAWKTRRRAAQAISGARTACPSSSAGTEQRACGVSAAAVLRAAARSGGAPSSSRRRLRRPHQSACGASSPCASSPCAPRLLPHRRRHRHRRRRQRPPPRAGRAARPRQLWRPAAAAQATHLRVHRVLLPLRRQRTEALLLRHLRVLRAPPLRQRAPQCGPRSGGESARGDATRGLAGSRCGRDGAARGGEACGR